MHAWINLWHFLVSCPQFHYCSGRLFILCTGNKTTIISRALFIHIIAQLQQQLSGAPDKSSASSCSLTLPSVPQPAQAPTVLIHHRALTLNPNWKHTAKHPLPLAARLWMTKATNCVILVKSDLYFTMKLMQDRTQLTDQQTSSNHVNIRYGSKNTSNSHY